MSDRPRIDPELVARKKERRAQNYAAKQRQRQREAKGLALYWQTLPTSLLEAALEAEGLLPRYPQVGRDHVHSHGEVEAALTAFIMKKICQR